MPTTHAELDPLADLAGAIKEVWRDGGAPDIAAAVLDHPELLRRRSLVVDLAYEEYCLREEAGCPPEPEQFCQRVPAFRSEVREVIRGHRVFAEHPELFELPQAEVAWPEPGDRFEGLRVVQELGRGAFARAYLATDPETGNRPVALKLSPAPSGEARTLGPIGHPHIVGVHWAKSAGGLHAMCMPFVGATTLNDVIEATFRRRPARPRSARPVLDAIDHTAAPGAPATPALLRGRESYPDAVAVIAARLADALAHLVQLGVCHGDLKPSNIILGPGGHPYLIDFNLATGPADSLLRCGGTLPYMAPERLRLLLGEGRIADPAAADVYSLGVVLFETLAGKLPFAPATFSDPKWVAADLLGRQADAPPRLAVRGIPGSLAGIVERCLAPDPGSRPTAAGLARELRRYLGPSRWPRRLLTAASVVGCLLCWEVWPAFSAALNPDQPWAVAARPKRPITAEEFFARGAESLQGGDVEGARKDFHEANRLHPDGRNTAVLAYCHAHSAGWAGHGTAVNEYDKAVKKYGYDEPWVHNNRAASLIKLGSPDHLRLAIHEANAALKADPTLRAARLNRAYAQFRLHRETNSGPFNDPQCVTDIQAVVDEGFCTADLYYKAACILAISNGPEEYAARAVTYLQEAVNRGRHPGRLKDDPLLKGLVGRTDFVEVVKLPQVPRPEAESCVNLHVIDPPLR